MRFVRNKSKLYLKKFLKIIEEQNELSQKLKEIAINEGFNPVGIAKVPGSSRIKLRTASLERWLEAGYQGNMNWMKASRRKNIETLLDGVKSVLAVGLNYYVDIDQQKNSFRIGRFAWGIDYHKTIKKRLKKIGLWLESQRPESKWRVCVDSSSLLEKAWAEEAGLGWIGKHTNLINPKQGSWMVLGYLLSTEQLTADSPAKSLCGKCKKCIEACPTKAITEPFVIDARLCLPYHTMENRDPKLPEKITSSMGKWIAGCDICQEKCPWNHKQIPSSNDPDVQPKKWILNLTNDQIMNWKENEWNENLRDSTLKRIKPWMWKRNAEAINGKFTEIGKNKK